MIVLALKILAVLVFFIAWLLILCDWTGHRRD